METPQELATLKLTIQELEETIKHGENYISNLQEKLQRVTPDRDQIEAKIRVNLSDSVWFHLQQGSQKDLCFADRNYEIINSEKFTSQISDYSEAGLRLGFVIEREIVRPFFKSLYQYLLINNNKSYNFLANPNFEIGGVIVSSKGKYTMGSLPQLLSVQWTTFKDKSLNQAQLPKDELYQTVFFGNQINQADRYLLGIFLQQWQHPLSSWLREAEIAASKIDQINKLRNIAAHGENYFYEWQFNILRLLVVGGKKQRGVLQEIYD
ncbi:hypothetical protein BCD67_19575 [Oscillatoriales cyanobacterium USR001]|nr:hypothetical protein BCD67_19575 [Oscillatoriales cyanobacterium USR001]